MTGIFPTAYFGSIAYFQELVRFDEAVIETCDHFPKQTFRNRCTIVTPQGPARLSVPVEKPGGSKTPTTDIRVSEHADWRKDHWRAIQSAYASAPYFDHYAAEVHDWIYSKERSLIQFNLQHTQWLLGCFGLEVAFRFTEMYLPSYAANDFRAVSFDDEQPADFHSLPYTQVYFGNTDFTANASILDLLFCEGPMGRKQLLQKD